MCVCVLTCVLSVMQALYFIPLIREGCLAHSCDLEHCLACELNFLFRMLDDSHGLNCQASNFLRALRHRPNAEALGLLDTVSGQKVSTNIALPQRIEAFTSFLFEQLHQDCVPKTQGNAGRASKKERDRGKKDKEDAAHNTFVERAFGCDLQTEAQCEGCMHKSQRQSRTRAFDMSYDEAKKESSFCDVVAETLCNTTYRRMVCVGCKRNQLINLHTVVEEPPNLMVLKAGLGDKVSELAEDLWRQADWVKESLRISTDPAKHKVKVEVPDLGAPASEEGAGKLYKLSAIITRVHDKRIKTATKDHFVAAINVPTCYVQSDASPRRKRTQSTVGGDQDPDEPDSPTAAQVNEGGWIVFNDFRVGKTNLGSVLDFTSRWKVPCVLVYAQADTYGAAMKLQPPPPLPPVLASNYYRSMSRNTASGLSFQPICEDETLQAGSLVAIDAEFVAIKGEEVEIRSDGTRAVTKAATMSLGRVSVVRGEGELSEVPFIDDYIATSEHIEDYLTQFSGLRQGDLDTASSSHHLLPLKQVYKKLVYLTTLGCVFVGHNLKSDFRVINILVPPEQIRDTVDLFYIKGRRRIGLRWLCSYLLGTERGFQEGEHDSIEDSIAALRLYKLYQEVEKKGPQEVEAFLEDIYLGGNISSWEPKSSEEWGEIKRGMAENKRVLQERMAAEAAVVNIVDEVPLDSPTHAVAGFETPGVGDRLDG